jgi:predicted GH43/DUF377 family glycosyl hydrolase
MKLLFVCICLLLCARHNHAGAGENAPEYEVKWNYIMNVSSRQKYFIDYWRFPDPIRFNTGMGLWPLNTNDKQYKQGGSLFIIAAQGYVCKNCPSVGYVFSLNGTKLGPITHFFNPVHSTDDDGNTVDGVVGDPRIFRYGGKTYALCVGGKYGVQQPYLSEVVFNNVTNALQLKEPVYMSTDHEFGHHSQKNWSPFDYTFKRQAHHEKSLTSKTFFVFSIFPHRIVDTNETISKNLLKTHTICLTEMTEPMDQLWQWGPMHGGTNSVLVDTPYGPRYLAIFHSQNHFMISWMTTYFMGAYMFETEPPFAITHITTEPIIPTKLYTEDIDGWSFKVIGVYRCSSTVSRCDDLTLPVTHIDYIMFPMNIIQYDDKLLVSIGRNDRSGYMLVLNTTEFISTLKPVHSKVVKDRFYEHVFYSGY